MPLSNRFRVQYIPYRDSYILERARVTLRVGAIGCREDIMWQSVGYCYFKTQDEAYDYAKQIVEGEKLMTPVTVKEFTV